MQHRFLRWVTVSVLAFMAMALGDFTTLSAQQGHLPGMAAPIDTSIGTYVIRQGTTLFELARQTRGDGNRWKEIYDANIAAGRLNPSSLRPNGNNDVPIVILNVGDTLVLNRVAAAKAPATVAEVEVAPAPALAPKPVQVVIDSEAGSDRNITSWLWFAALALVMLIGLIALIRWKLSNPVSSGPPMRPQPVTNESAPDRFREMASARTGTVGSPNYVPPERIRLLNIRRGRGHGIMRVSYGDGRQETKRLTGEVVYEARVEFPGGRQETLYCLEACANDLVYAGNRYVADRLFRFEPDGASIPIPQPETVVAIGGIQVSIGNDDLTLTQAGRTITVDADGLRKSADGGLILTKEGHADVLFQNGRIQGAALPVHIPRRRTAPRATVGAEAEK